MPPEITVIIPVYNVEPWLRECMDSVINQTMRDIQIICVNDGSPDGSRAILQEYADRDSRVEIIDKPNGGLSSARNTAYPFIKGRYTMFVDSDDWLAQGACETAYRKVEETGAEYAIFFDERMSCEPGKSVVHGGLTPEDRTEIEEKIPLLGWVTAWGKLFRSDFLLQNHLYFPEGLIFEDNPVHWKAVTRAQRISIVPEVLYYYRFRPGQITQCDNERFFDIIPICCLIRDDLMTTGYYDDYRDAYYRHQWNNYYCWYNRLYSPKIRSRFREKIRLSLTKEDKAWLRNPPRDFPKHVSRLYRFEIGWNRFGTPVSYCVKAADYCCEFLKRLGRFLRRVISNGLKPGK